MFPQTLDLSEHKNMDIGFCFNQVLSLVLDRTSG